MQGPLPASRDPAPSGPRPAAAPRPSARPAATVPPAAGTPSAGDGDRLICLGVVAGARGLRGEVWVRTFTREAAAIAGYGPLVDDTGRCFSVRVVAVDGDRARVRIVGIEDRTAAEALNGVRLHVPRRALPPPAEDEFYHADLIGLAVRFVDPAAADPAAADPAAARPAGGRVTAVADHGAGTVLEVTPDDGGPVILVPFSRAAVPEVDLAGGFLAVAWLPGLAADPGAGG